MVQCAGVDCPLFSRKTGVRAIADWETPVAQRLSVLSCESGLGSLLR